MYFNHKKISTNIICIAANFPNISLLYLALYFPNYSMPLCSIGANILCQMWLSQIYHKRKKLIIGVVLRSMHCCSILMWALLRDSRSIQMHIHTTTSHKQNVILFSCIHSTQIQKRLTTRIIGYRMTAKIKSKVNMPFSLFK